MITTIERIISAAQNIFSICGYLIALYLYFFKKDEISTAFNTLLNYSKQLSLTDLKSKFERLNDYNANDEKQKEEVINILHEIEGQLNGNVKLKGEFKTVLKKVNSFTNSKKEISEAYKRSLVNELRENLRNIDIETYNGITNKKTKK